MNVLTGKDAHTADVQSCGNYHLLFSDHVPLTVMLDINVDHVFERNYCRKLAWHKAKLQCLPLL